ncbi:MAG: preprotein translocase subunit SecE [Syntrophomonas sp.]
MKNWWNSGKQYFTGVYNELKKVHWPGRVQLIGYTGVVLLSVAIVALILWLFDSGLSFLLERLTKVFA